MTGSEIWTLRRRTARAMVWLVIARLTVRWLRFSAWRERLGWPGVATAEQEQFACRLGRHVERAASRLPGTSKCLPQAMALSWLLRAQGVPHSLELLIRPRTARGGLDDLHAMVRCNKQIVLGLLSGPWIAVLVRPATHP